MDINRAKLPIQADEILGSVIDGRLEPHSLESV